MTLKPGLYVVSTPIGNLNDITIRALETLKSSDVIVCEDTRVSQKLLAKHSVNTQLIVYNDKSNETIRKKIMEMAKSGKVLSLISDAGTPLISDPGYKLAKSFHEEGLHVDVVPGVSAPIAALSLSGLPTDSFFFGGFLPKTSALRKKKFQQVSSYDATLIFFETASRITDSVNDALATLGARSAVITRELTKLFQERIEGDLQSIAEKLKSTSIKGEIVLLISGKTAGAKLDLHSLDELIHSKLIQGISARDIADDLFTKEVSASDNITKSEIYRYVNLIKKEK